MSGSVEMTMEEMKCTLAISQHAVEALQSLGQRQRQEQNELQDWEFQRRKRLSTMDRSTFQSRSDGR